MVNTDQQGCWWSSPSNPGWCHLHTALGQPGFSSCMLPICIGTAPSHGERLFASRLRHKAFGDAGFHHGLDAYPATGMRLLPAKGGRLIHNNSSSCVRSSQTLSKFKPLDPLVSSHVVGMTADRWNDSDITSTHTWSCMCLSTAKSAICNPQHAIIRRLPGSSNCKLCFATPINKWPRKQSQTWPDYNKLSLIHH